MRVKSNINILTKVINSLEMNIHSSLDKIDMNHIVSACGGIIPFEGLVKDIVRPYVENKFEKFNNFFIIRYELQLGLTDKYIRVYWSADNFPNCQKIYADNYHIRLSDLIIYYRNYQLNQILLNED